MKEIVLGAIHELQTDLHDIAQLRFEENNNDQHTFEVLSLRVKTLYELVEKYFDLTDESAKNAVRWKFLFQTPGISFKLEEGKSVVFKDVVQGGEIVGRKMIAGGQSLPEAVDTFLGFR